MTTIDIKSLTPHERLNLISELWDSLEADEVTLTPEQETELDRRLETADSDIAVSVPWELVRAQLAAIRR